MCRSSTASSFGTKRQMSAIISTRLMAAIVYWILVRDSSLAFRDGRLWSPTTSPEIMFWCVLVPAGAPHIMSGSPTERAFPPRAEILAEMLGTTAGDRRPPGELKPVKHSRTWIVSVSLSPPVLLTAFLLDCGHDGNRRSPGAKAAKPRRDPPAGG